MTLWQTIAGVTTLGGDKISLRQREDLFEIRYNGIELMSNLNHHSEEQLALQLLRRTGFQAKRILIAGLGMGFTLRSVLDHAGDDAQVTVCKLIPEVAAWNRTHLAHLARAPLGDRRVKLVLGDIRDHLATASSPYDLILMDTDNGPDIVIRPDNTAIYDVSGLGLVSQALSANGVAAFWSAMVSPRFERALTGFGWHWQREDIALIPGRVDAMHHIYTCHSSEAMRLQRAA